MDEKGNLEYLSRVFKRLTVERKDYVLHTARSLLEIQDENARNIPVDNPLFQEKKESA